MCACQAFGDGHVPWVLPMVWQLFCLGKCCTGSGLGVTMHSTHHQMMQHNHLRLRQLAASSIHSCNGYTPHGEVGAGSQAGTATQHFNGSVDSLQTPYIYALMC